MQNEITEALKAARKRMRNCMGAIESNQVVDKDVHGSLKRGIADIDEALSAALTQAAEPVAWTDAFELEGLAKPDNGSALMFRKSVAAKIATGGKPIPLYTSSPVASPEPEGWVMVPREPTSGMLIAGEHGPVHVLGMWRAMLSARPTPPCDGRAEALEEAANEYVAEQGFEHSGGIIESAFEAGAEWAALATRATTPTGTIAWESTTTGYKRFVTDKQYRGFSENARRWYKPYRCSNCATTPTASELLEALRKCRQTLAMMVEPGAITGSTIIHAYASAVEAISAADRALSNIGEAP